MGTIASGGGGVSRPGARYFCPRWRWCFFLPPAGYFLSRAKESTQRTPPKPTVLDSFGALGSELICKKCSRAELSVVVVGQKDCAGTAFRCRFADAALSHGRGGVFYRMGDYQIAPFAARSAAKGRWRLAPPGNLGERIPTPVCALARNDSAGRCWGRTGSSAPTNWE